MTTHSSLTQVFAQTLEQSSDGVIIIDSTGHIVFFNRAAEQLWGFTEEDVLGRFVGILVPERFHASHAHHFDTQHFDRLNQLIGNNQDIPLQHKDGRTHWINLSISRIESEGNVLFSAFIKDITNQHLETERTRLLSLIVDQTDNATIITNGDWQIVHINPGFCRMFGYDDPSEVIGRTPTQVIAPYLETERVEEMRNLLRNGSPYHAEEIAYTHDGQRIWCKVATNPVCDERGALLNTVTILTDITHSKMHEVLQNRMLKAMVRETPLAELMTLACQEVERIAPDVVASILKVDKLGGLHPLAGPSLPDEYSNLIEGVNIGPMVGTCGTAAHLGESVLSEDISRDPRWAPFKHWLLPLGLKACWSTPIKSSDGHVLGTFAFYYREIRKPSPMHRQLVDVISHLCALALEREESRIHIRQLAFYDNLTGLPNRNLLQAKAEQAVVNAERNHSCLAVLFIDVDRFKQINDSLGHPAGDELLRLIAQRLNDQRGPSDIVSRLSGDEFVMVLARKDNQHITETVEHLKASLMAPAQISGVTITPSASIGISLYPENGHDVGSLIHRADMAMYQAKSSGRGHFRFFSQELNRQAQERMILENALRDALEGQQLVLHYQPQINLQNGALHGMEALARWYHPQWGEVSPARFIPLAEDCGLIGELSAWALREACRQLSEWRRKGLNIPSISVNLSPTNFHNLDLPGMIAGTLRQHNLLAKDLTLEITENVLMDTNPGTLQTLEEIHAKGIRLSLDDFGTGYSSLSYLRRLPIQELKLDRSFVMDLENDVTNQALSEAVIRLGDSLQLTVIAEGVETEAQHQLLRKQGYDAAQGYLFARPMPASELERWLGHWPSH